MRLKKNKLVNFFLPKYIATRVYHNANAIKSVIVNEVEKEFIELRMIVHYCGKVY